MHNSLEVPSRFAFRGGSERLRSYLIIDSKSRGKHVLTPNLFLIGYKIQHLPSPLLFFTTIKPTKPDDHSTTHYP